MTDALSWETALPFSPLFSLLLTLLHSEQPKLLRVLAVLSAKGLKEKKTEFCLAFLLAKDVLKEFCLCGRNLASWVGYP